MVIGKFLALFFDPFSVTIATLAQAWLHDGVALPALLHNSSGRAP